MRNKSKFIFSFFLTHIIALSLNSQCLEVLSHSKISDTRGYFNGSIDSDDRFGVPASIGDLNNDGIGDIAVGARKDDDGGTNRGAIYIIFLDKYGRAISHQKISDTQGNFTDTLDNGDEFGSAVCLIGDLNSDGNPEIMVGAQYDDDGGTNRGAVWILSIDSSGSVISQKKISDTRGGFGGILDNFDTFGNYFDPIGDLNGDGFMEVAVGSYNDDDGGTDRGAVYILSLDTGGSVLSEQKISDTQGNFTGTLNNGDKFGRPSGIGDINGDNIPDIAVGSPGDDDGGTDKGAVWILFLDTNGTVKSHQKISDTQGNFFGTLSNSDQIGNNVKLIGDINSDGVNDIMVSSSNDDDGGADRGALWLMLLTSNGTVGRYQKISDTEGHFKGALDNYDHFGSRLSFLGDFNNDGLTDIAASATHDDDGGTDGGAVWILTLGCVGGCAGETQNTFEKVFKADGTDIAQSIINTSDNGYAVTGYTNSMGAGSNDWFVLKLNADGDSIWSRTYGGTGNDLGQTSRIRQLPDDGYLVTGRTYGYNTSGSGGLSILRLDQNGNAVWLKIVDSIANENARAIQLTQDGGFVIAGTNGFVLKFDSLGNMQWNSYFSGGGNMHMSGIIEIPERNEYLLTGSSTGYGSGGRSGYLIYVDSSGTKLWERTYDSPTQDAFMSSIRTNDKGFISVGYTNGQNNNRALLVKVDSVGKFIWSRYYNNNNTLSRGIELIEAQNDGYIMTGYSNVSATYKNFISKVDDYGNIVWSNLYKGNASTWLSYSGESITPTSDGGYLFANHGAYVSGGASSGADEDIYLVKMGKCGTACSEVSITFSDKEREMTLNDPVSTVQNWGTLSSVTVVQGTFSVTDSLLCEYDPSCQMQANFITDTVCVGDTTSFTDLSWDSLANVTGWQWYFGDGDTNFIDHHPLHKYDSVGTFIARLIIFNDDTTYCSDTLDLPVVVLPVPNPNLGPDTTYCYGQVITLNPIIGAYTYFWSDSSTNSTLIVDSTGTYWTTVSNQACSATDSVQLIFDISPNLDIGPDTIICLGDSISINLNISNATYFWSDATTNNYNSFKIPGQHWVKIDSGACTISDSIILTVNSYPMVNLGNDTTFCSGDTITLFGSLSQFKHLWSTGDTTIFLDADTNSIYWLQVSNGPCSTTDTVELFMDIRPSFELGNDTILCQGDTLRLSTNLTSPNLFQWNTGSMSPNILVDSTGIFHVQVINGVCIEYDTVLVSFDDSIIVNLGIDTTLCQGISYTLNAFNSGASYVWYDSSLLSSLILNQPGKYWVEVISQNGVCYGSDSVNVYYDSIPLISLGNDTSICEGDTVHLNAYWPGATYFWYDNSNLSTKMVKNSGKKWVQVTNGKCQTSDTINLNVFSFPFFNLDSNYMFCAGDTLKIEIDSTFDRYNWSNSDSSFYTTFLDSGIHWVKASNYRCHTTDTFSLSFLKLPEALNKREYEICELGYADVDAGNKGATYSWSDGSNKMINRITDTGKVYVLITLENGCYLIDSCEVSYCEFEVDIPNTITPNGDGSNDYWIIDGIEYYPENVVQIFNRNGQVLFETNGYKNNWDGKWNGKDLPASVYFYIVDLGSGYNKFKGTLTIIRE